ncbi:hypothetical protein Tco_1395062 [Tanacetum coccineum]
MDMAIQRRSWCEEQIKNITSSWRVGDFPRVHLNDIKDMLLLIVQNKHFNLEGDVIVDLAVALRMPQKRDVDISFKEPYTTHFEPQGVIYKDKLERKTLMRTDELYKFSDGTLKSVCNTLHHMLLNFRLGYSKSTKKRKWTATDQRRTHIMIKDIDELLLERVRSLKKFIGGRDYGTNYRLLQRTI